MKKITLLLIALVAMFTANADVNDLAGSYTARQTGTSYISSGYTAWQAYDTTWVNTVSVSGNDVTLTAFVGTYFYSFKGTADETANTITFAPQTCSWMTVAGTDSAAQSFTATYKKTNDSIFISFPQLSVWYGSYAYESVYSLELAGQYTAKSQDWTSEANIVYYDAQGAEVYSGKCNIARYTGYTYKYQVTNYGNPEASTYTSAVNFNVIASAASTKKKAVDLTEYLTLDYSNAYGGYFYYVLSNTDDMWMEGGKDENKTSVVGNDNNGSLTWYYWRYDLSNNYAELSEGNVVVSWPYVAPTPTGVNDINAAKKASVRKVMENGQIVIYNGDAKYNVMGMRIQ